MTNPSPPPARDDPPASVGDSLPTGTVTFLFTDIEGSTRLLERLGEGYAEALAAHRRLLRAAFAAHGGRELSTEGDSFFVVFAGAHEAVAAAADAQRALAAHAWPGERPLRVRAGLHTAEAFRGPEPYIGLGVHLAARIAAAAHGGQVLLSATTRALLDRPPAGVRLVDLGEHRLKDFSASQRLFQLVVDGLPAEFPPVRALEAVEPAPVPRPATPTIGREAEIRAVCERLTDPAVRLLTLTGPGGVGKTRLAVEVARRAAPAFDGARFVGLASVSDPRDVPAALVRQLGARPDDADAPLAAIARHLGGRRLLLVLDNLEQLLAAAPLIGGLLDACPALTVLLTSREATRLSAERVHEVPPLDVADAVALFGDRAAARDPAFTVDAGNVGAVEAICRRLDGLPLAVQLAAARIGILTPAELTQRLQLAALGGGPSDAEERHRTVRATIDWSYELLDAAERDAFAGMAVFAGGATLSAAEEVTGASLDTLASLLDKHLVLRRGERLVLLEPVREYALERLAGEEAWRRLARWCRDIIRDARPRLRGVDRVPTLSSLDAELPNALSALEVALARGWVDVAAEVVEAWSLYWTETFGRDQGLRWIDAVLAQTGDAPPEMLLARAHVDGVRTTDRGRTRADLQAALAGFRARDDPRGIAESLSLLAVHEGWTEEFVAAPRLVEEAIHQAERSGDDATIATVLRRAVIAGENYGIMAARAHQAIPRLQRLGYIDDIVGIASPVGYVGLAEGRAAEARSWFEAGLLAARSLGDPKREAGLLNNLGLAELFLGDAGAARASLQEALRLVHERDPHTPYIPECLLGLAVLAARDDDEDRAARLAGAAQAQLGVGNAASEDQIWQRLRELLADYASDDERWDDLERAGAALSLAAAVDLGFAVTVRP